MLARGAVAVGEAGPGSDIHWPDYVLIPEAVQRQTGCRLLREQAVVLRELVERGAVAGEIDGALARFGVSGMTAAAVEELVAATQSWQALSREACYEAAALAKQFDAPLVLHNTRQLLTWCEKLPPKIVTTQLRATPTSTINPPNRPSKWPAMSNRRVAGLI